MKVLVTGGAGFIGANYVLYSLKHHPEDEIVALQGPEIIALHRRSRRDDAPAKADEKKTPILHKLRRLAFEIMADKLQDPTEHKKHKCLQPHSFFDKRRGNQQNG